MTTELFEGKPSALQARIDVILAGPATSVDVVVTHQKGFYLLLIV
jgi:hypothetical protein